MNKIGKIVLSIIGIGGITCFAYFLGNSRGKTSEKHNYEQRKNKTVKNLLWKLFKEYKETNSIGENIFIRRVHPGDQNSNIIYHSKLKDEKNGITKVLTPQDEEDLLEFTVDQLVQPKFRSLKGNIGELTDGHDNKIAVNEFVVDKYLNIM